MKKFRQYIAKAATISPTLLQEERIKIEEDIKEKVVKDKGISEKLSNIMKLSKLMSRSHGRSDILFEDYERAACLHEQQVPPKPVQ